MKVIYTIAHVGAGHAFEGGRTGIVRVIKNIAKQLALHSECDVTFSSDE